ncbi:MAG: NUDIX domain-containing protein [Tunicatimonas sp.]
MIIDKVALVKTDAGKMLVARSRGKTKYYAPGGKREAGETDEQTLSREIKEELNVSILADTIRYLGTFEAQADGRAAGVIVRMICYEADYLDVPEESAEIEEIRWLSFADIDLVAEVDRQVFAFLKDFNKLA